MQVKSRVKGCTGSEGKQGRKVENVWQPDEQTVLQDSRLSKERRAFQIRLWSCWDVMSTLSSLLSKGRYFDEDDINSVLFQQVSIYEFREINLFVAAVSEPVHLELALGHWSAGNVVPRLLNVLEFFVLLVMWFSLWERIRVFLTTSGWVKIS